MTTRSAIQLFATAENSGPQITQLYPFVELLREGTPPRHSLFVLEPGADLLHALETGDRLLVLDPPADLATRFRLPAETAVLGCSKPVALDLPQLQLIPGSVAHVRLGDQYLDIYTYTGGALVHFPPLGILYSAGFGSDLMPPALAHDSDGTGELDTLRLLARLLKQRRVRLLIPHIGSTCNDLPTMMARLAADVGYLHNLRRVLPALAHTADAPPSALIESLLPAERRSDPARERHATNVEQLLTTLRRRTTNSV